MLKRVNGFTGKLGNVGVNPTKSFPMTSTEPIQKETKMMQIQKPIEKERKSKFQKK